MDTGKKIDMEAPKGYLIVESGPDRPFKILFADEAVCDMTGKSMAELKSLTVPKPIPAHLESTSVELDADHRLWVLNTTDSRLQSEADIRTPMNAIVGMTAITLSHIDEKARVQDCLQKIQTASTHLMSLVNDVLDISRIDSDRMSLNEELFSLANLVHEVTVIARPQAVQKGHFSTAFTGGLWIMWTDFPSLPRVKRSSSPSGR